MNAVPQEWITFVRTGEIEFRIALNSKRLRRLLADVWESLPVADRNRLNNSLTIISDNSVLRYILANGNGYHIGEDNCFGCTVPLGDDHCFVFLNAAALRPKKTAFCKYVIAHELAHVFHGHSERNNQTRETREAEADQTAARWGYPDPELAK